MSGLTRSTLSQSSFCSFVPAIYGSSLSRCDRTRPISTPRTRCQADSCFRSPAPRLSIYHQLPVRASPCTWLDGRRCGPSIQRPHESPFPLLRQPLVWTSPRGRPRFVRPRVCHDDALDYPIRLPLRAVLLRPHSVIRPLPVGRNEGACVSLNPSSRFEQRLCPASSPDGRGSECSRSPRQT